QRRRVTGARREWIRGIRASAGARAGQARTHWGFWRTHGSHAQQRRSGNDLAGYRDARINARFEAAQGERPTRSEPCNSYKRDARGEPRLRPPRYSSGTIARIDRRIRYDAGAKRIRQYHLRMAHRRRLRAGRGRGTRCVEGPDPAPAEHARSESAAARGREDADRT